MGLFTLLLSVIAVSLFGSLIAADRALVASERELAALEARRSALVAARDLRLRAETLSEFFDPVLGGTSTANVQPPTGFEAIWVLDENGRLMFSQRPLSPSDSLQLFAVARRPEPARWPVVRVLSDSPRGILLIVPLTHRGEHLGTAVGLLPAADVLTAEPGDGGERAWLSLERAGRSLASTAPSAPESGRRAAAPIPLPGDTLLLVVARAAGGQELRRVLWLLGVLALAALFAGLARDRHQAVSLAARTAELERLYQEVARSNRMKSEFLANVSHELRTPLNAIVGFVEMLREGVYGDLSPRQALPADRIAASATHLRQLVDRLLDIAKIAAGRLEVHVEPIVLRAFVLNVASEMESLVNERGLSLSIAVPPTLPRINTDQTHLRQILINLIGNAVKYTPSGSIYVRAFRVDAGNLAAAEGERVPPIGAPPDESKPWIALLVSDTGVGVAPADRERIFDEFEQVNAGARTDSARRGTGLGLAISRRLARLLGGEITVASNPERGSTFTVWLPLDAEPEEAEASPEPRARTSV